MEETSSPPTSEKDTMNLEEDFTLTSESSSQYKMKLIYNNSKIVFFIEKLNEFPVLNYELETTLKELQNKEDNLILFNSTKKLVRGIKTCIETKKYKYSGSDSMFVLSLENDFFENKIANIEIPLKEQDLKVQVNYLIQVISNLKKEINELKQNPLQNNVELKKKTAINSITKSAFLDDNDKVLLSEWIDPHKIIRFSLLFSTNIDGTSSSSTFHYYCDGAFPTITVIYDTGGRKFGGYTTQSWTETKSGPSYCRDEFAFIFNLSNKVKYGLKNKFDTNAIYRYNSYGPTFGGGHDLCVANSCTGNTSSYTSNSSYDTGNYDILGGSSSTSFQVSYYEVYKVIFE
jgi:hypothetical protein